MLNLSLPDSGKLYLKVTCVLVPVMAIGLMFTLPYITSPPEACDLTSVLHRDFYHYYGLVNVDNPLSHANAERGGTINSKCHLFYDHMRLFPPGELPLSKSMIVQSLRGSGKTQIRQCVISRLSQNNHVILNLYGPDIKNYLDNFVKNIDITSELPYEKINKYWTKEHFLQVMLTEIASRFINKKYISILKKKQYKISLRTRREVATLLSFYSTKDYDTLCTIINVLLHDLTEYWICWIINCRIPCTNLQLSNTNPEMFIELAERHRKIKVKRHTADTDASLRLLLAMYTKTQSSPLPDLHNSYRDQLAMLINFLSTLDITTTVIVDSLDEIAFFFDEADQTLGALQTFVNSVTNNDILHLALGNWGEGIANMCTFYILIPKIPNKPVNISWTRQDKIPIIDLKWNDLLLINYVDYMFDYLRTKSHDKCKTLPDICSLLGGEKLCVATMKQLRHPRDFHIFFDVLTQHMGTVCTHRNPAFIATEKDLTTVLEETNQRILKEESI